MNNIYVIYLTEYIGDKLPRWYIGSTFKENITKRNYHGSPRSKQWMKIFKEEESNNPHLFKTEIIQECYDREAAIDIERKFQILANAVERDDYINKSYAGGSFGKGNLTTPESIAKGLETKRKNGIFDKNSPTVLKTIETKKKNGSNICKEETKRKISKSNTGKKMKPEQIKKRLDNIMVEDENGMSIAKLNGLKMRNTRMDKINEDGLNDYQILGLNQSKLMNTILESGETEAQRRGKIISKTRIEKGIGKGANNGKAKLINIYNAEGILMFECHGNFKQICLENGLPIKSLANSYKNNSRKLYQTCLPNKKEFIPFTGWYAIEIKEIKCQHLT